MKTGMGTNHKHSSLITLERGKGMKTRLFTLFVLLVSVTLLVLVLPLGAGVPAMLSFSQDLVRAAPSFRLQGDAPWGPNVQVNDDTGPNGHRSPAIAVDSSGNAYVVWEAECDGSCRDIYFSFRPVGGNWKPSVRVNDSPSSAGVSSPDIAVDSAGNAYAVWVDTRRQTHCDIYFAYRPAGGSWGFNVRVNDDGDAANHGVPAITVDGMGNAYAVWLKQYAGSYEFDICFAYRPAGGNWGTSTIVEDAQGRPAWDDEPDIAVDAFGNVYIVWPDWRDGSRDIYFSFRAVGESWESNVRVNDDTGGATSQTGPRIAVDPSGNAYAVWVDDRQGYCDIYFSYRPAGRSWEANVRVNDLIGAALQGSTAIALDPSGNTNVLWMCGDWLGPDIYFSHRPRGGGWDSAIRVNDDTGTASQRFPDIAVDAFGNAYAVWADNRNGNFDIYFSYRPAAGPTPTPSPTPTPTSEPEPKLSISHIEVTQAIQDESNSVPLIEGKPTFVRVYVDCGEGCSSLPNVTGVLHGYGPSGELPGSPISPVNRFITAYHEDWQSQRDDLRKTLNFTLPPEWRTGNVTLTAEVSGASRSETATFQSARTPNVIYVPIRYNGQTPDLSRVQNGSWWAFRVYPTAKINYIQWPTMDWSPGFQCQLSSDCLKRDLKNKLTDRYRQGRVGGYIFGWLSEEIRIGVGGSSDPKWAGGAGKAAFALDDPKRGPRFFAHEIGHLMGRRHTNTGECGDVDPDTDWPYSTAKIQDYGLDGYGFGWLVSSSGAVKNPANTYDYMSYCGSLAESNVWTSSWTYEHIWSETLRLQATTLAAQPLSTPQPCFIASGLVYIDDTASLDPVWVITSTVTPENPPEGTQYCLEVQDISGTSLVSRCFDLAFVNYEIGEATNVDGFNLMLPYPADVARIVLKKSANELAVQAVSANAPEVSILSPNGGENWSATGTYTITWSADDADNDPLTYSVLYSPDGSNWIPVGAVITQTQLAVNAGELVGSNNARIRVMASDGVNTSSDESDSSFIVGRKPPQAFILSPEQDVTVLPSSVLWFQGWAYDLEDGTLDGNALEWSSSKDGTLGTGTEILVTLSPGQHAITLAARDSDDNTSTATVNVFVGYKVYLPLILRVH